MIRFLDNALEYLIAAGRWLVVPLVLLLFLQWPLRDLVKGWSREANDLGQCFFAVFVALSVTAATRARRHLGTDVVAEQFSPNLKRRLVLLVGIGALAPWSAFVLVSAWPVVKATLSQLEAFPDTYNPGYFIVKSAVALLALLVLAQVLVDCFRSRRPAAGGEG